MAKMINFDVVPDMVDNTRTIMQISAQGFLDWMAPLCEVLKNTEQTEPVIQEILQLSKKVEENYNALVAAAQVHHGDLMSITEIAELLQKRDTGVEIKAGEDVGVKATARVDAIKNL